MVGRFDGPPFNIDAWLDRRTNANALIDSGCLTYGIIKETFARKKKLNCSAIKPRPIKGYDGSAPQYIKEIACVTLDIGGNIQEKAYFYVVPKCEYDMILGLPWMEHQHVRIDAAGGRLEFGNGISVDKKNLLRPEYAPRQIGAAAVNALKRMRSRKKEVDIFAVSMRDIEKALAPKPQTDPGNKLPKHYHEFLELFDPKEADKLPPSRPNIDHQIELIDADAKGRKPEIPWGPLYNMSREELLVLRKTLHDLLSKDFIRVSNSPAAAPVLFVRKPGGGLRFCVDYRALNAMTKRDRYPLPLIHETLQRISKARWFTKLDVTAAFHKIRIAEGDEWKTAFRTRFGLYEWLVTPFGLTNAPSTFQRYINWTLREFLDDFVSAYLDDVLIFTEGSRAHHRKQVMRVLERLRTAGLQLDINKCEFEVQTTKYLGFILEAGKGIRMDPAKVSAILEWKAPTCVKDVRSFLGFANFYRQFIRGYSDIIRPLTELTKKGTTFVWTKAANEAFEQLKQMFVSDPILVQFDPEQDTIVEADSSGYVVGGTLSQYDNKGLLRTCAYFSRKCTPAECNYEIHDKELLAIIACLKQWEPELIGTKEFTILTDHRNLKYFMQLRRLNERQMRWAGILSRFNYKLQYRPGRLAARPDALSRRSQDMPDGIDDERLAYRNKRLINPNKVRRDYPEQPPQGRLSNTAPEPHVHATHIEHLTSIGEQWRLAEAEDKNYERIKEAVRQKLPRFPQDLQLRTMVSECTIDAADRLLFRNRQWVPNSAPLRTRIIQDTHDSYLTGHPGRNMTYAIVARQLYWPNLSEDVRRFVNNCDKCGANTVWRQRRQGLLKPLPVPSRMWRDISMDFIEKLPMSDGNTNLMVIVDRLGKGIILVPCKHIDTETVISKFVDRFIREHGPPSSIISDRGTQFVNDLWKGVCERLKIMRRLSTAHHPQTDGQTERANSVVEEYLRNFCTYLQTDWSPLTAIAQLAINGRDATATGISPFFLTHGYNVEPLQLDEAIPTSEQQRPAAERANDIVTKLRQAFDIAQTELVSAQQRMEDSANRRRETPLEYKVGQKVWLDLRNIRTERPSKKLDARHAKYTILEKVGSHAYRLDVPGTIHDVFHTTLLRPAGTRPLPSQTRHDYQPPAHLVEGNEEYLVDSILDERTIRRGRGHMKQYLVRWTGYARPTWEPARSMEDTEALDHWLQHHNALAEGGE